VHIFGQDVAILEAERDHEGMNTELVRAINERRLIEFVYKGGRPRIAEPHDYGIRRGNPHGWKDFDVVDMSQLRVLDRTFPGARGDRNQKSLKWDKLFARVK
jgi:hypothetical protein